MARTPPVPVPSRATNATLAVGLGIAVVLVYGQVAWHDFINFDDDAYVTRNEYVRAGLTPESMIWAFTTTEGSNWNPLTWLSLELDAQLFGTQPTGFHLTNLVLHLANSLLVLALFRRLTGAVWASGLVAALFALHPLHVESVAWIAERKDVLSTCFGLLALLAYAGYAERLRVGRYLAFLALFALSLLAKPMLVTLPGVLILLDYWPLQRFGSRQVSLRRLMLEKMPPLALALIFSGIAIFAQDRGGSISSLEIVPLHLRIENALNAYIDYLLKTLWPVDLIPFYPHPGESVAMARVVVSGVVLLLLTLIVIWQWRRRPYLLVGWLWYLGTLVPVIGLVQVGNQALADRYTYFPLIGIFVAVTWGSAELLRRAPALRFAGILGAAVVLALCSIATGRQVGYWQDSITLWEYTLRVDPNNYLAHYNLADALAQHQRWSEAANEYAAALHARPWLRLAHYNRGLILARLGKREAAIAEYRQEIARDPANADAHNALGLAFAQQGQTKEAADEFAEAVRQRPQFAQAQNNLGLALADQDQVEEAIKHLRAAVAIQPDYAIAHNNLGRLLLRQGRVEAAIQHFQEALRIEPGFRLAQDNLALARARQSEGGRAPEPIPPEPRR